MKRHVVPDVKHQEEAQLSLAHIGSFHDTWDRCRDCEQTAGWFLVPCRSDTGRAPFIGTCQGE